MDGAQGQGRNRGGGRGGSGGVVPRVLCARNNTSSWPPGLNEEEEATRHQRAQITWSSSVR